MIPVGYHQAIIQIFIFLLAGDLISQRGGEGPEQSGDSEDLGGFHSYQGKWPDPGAVQRKDL